MESRERRKRRRRNRETYTGTQLPTQGEANVPESEMPPLDLESLRVRESIVKDVVKGTLILVGTVTGVYLLASGVQYFLPNEVTGSMKDILLTPENFDKWLEFFRQQVGPIDVSE